MFLDSTTQILIPSFLLVYTSRAFSNAISASAAWRLPKWRCSNPFLLLTKTSQSGQFFVDIIISVILKLNCHRFHSVLDTKLRKAISLELTKFSFILLLYLCVRRFWLRRPWLHLVPMRHLPMRLLWLSYVLYSLGRVL